MQAGGPANARGRSAVEIRRTSMFEARAFSPTGVLELRPLRLKNRATIGRFGQSLDLYGRSEGSKLRGS